jgi:hypothetical protein
VINVAFIVAVARACRYETKRAEIREAEQARVMERQRSVRQIPTVMGPDSSVCLLIDADYVEQQRIVARQGLQ